MDLTTIRMLTALERNIGRPLSINALSNEMDRGYYKNTYDTVQVLASKGLISIKKAGKSQQVEFDLDNNGLIDILAQIEFEKKRSIAEKDGYLGSLMSEITTRFMDGPATIGSLSIVLPLRNIALNRIELLVLLRPDASLKDPVDSKTVIYKALSALESRFDVKMDPLVLSRAEIVDIIGGRRICELRTQMSDQLCLLNPQYYWHAVAGIPKEHFGYESMAIDGVVKISSEDIAHNLMLYGYTEMGREYSKGRRYGFEETLAAAFMSDNARWKAALPPLLANNAQLIHPASLLFLCKKYGILKDMRKALIAASGTKKRIDVLEETVRYCDIYL